MIYPHPMETDRILYEIKIEGQLDPGWSEWFEHMAIESPTPATTCLRGSLPDQAALFGVLKKLHHLGLTLISVQRQKTTQGEGDEPTKYRG
jgi:hypothetical protein